MYIHLPPHPNLLCGGGALGTMIGAGTGIAGGESRATLNISIRGKTGLYNKFSTEHVCKK